LEADYFVADRDYQQLQLQWTTFQPRISVAESWKATNAVGAVRLLNVLMNGVASGALSMERTQARATIKTTRLYYGGANLQVY